MTIDRASLDWALDFLVAHGDGDLFPKLPEFQAVADARDTFLSQVGTNAPEAYKPLPSRRFIVPKDDLSYRQATQLAPQDSIFLTAAIHAYGAGIEARRLPADTVFSYRFAPTTDFNLYQHKSAWNDFWKSAENRSRDCGVVLYCDIADFYNQIYHHTVENQLIAAGFPNQVLKWIVRLLESTTAGVSRGVPIGPHAVHLIAEATLVPFDNSIRAAGLKFVRYADDIVVFCADKAEAKRALSIISKSLDKQQRLAIQRHKTKLHNPSEFQDLCRDNVADRPINSSESDVLTIVRKYSGGDPYVTISYNQMSPEDWSNISEKSVRNVILEYLAGDPIDYVPLRWFYRRLAQVGHPGALPVTLESIDALGPCLANVCTYLASVQQIEDAEWLRIGGQLLKFMEQDEVREQEYFSLSVLSLFGRNASINHFADLAKKFQSSPPFVRREIVLAARMAGEFDWLRELKESYQSMDPWQRWAFLVSTAGFPADEKKYFLSHVDLDQPVDKAVARWARGQTA